MRTILMALGLVTYWLTHPAAVQYLMRGTVLAVSALAHASGDHTTAQGMIVMFGSHWH